MSSLSDLKQAQHEGEAGAPLTAQETKFADQSITDLAALKIVLQDSKFAEQYLQTKTLPQEWDRVDDLFRAYVAPQTWPGSNLPRATLGMPLIMEVVETLMPQAHLAFFSDPQPFYLTPKGRTSPQAAKATAKLVCWAMDESGFKEEIRKAEKSAFTYGTGVVKWGWQSATKSRKKYSKSTAGAVQSEREDYEVSRPCLEQVPLRNLLVDPHTNCHDIRTAKYVVHQTFVTADDLDSMRDNGYENIPTRAELIMALAEGGEATEDSLLANKMQTYRENQAEWPNRKVSADPLAQPLELLEYWSADRVITVLQRKIVIRNEENEFGVIPFLSCAFIDAPGSFYGFGIGRLLEGEQRFETGVVNSWIDGLSLTLNPMFHRKKGIGAQTQNISAAPGKVINDDGDLTPITPTSVSFEAIQAIQNSEMRAHRRVGSNAGSEMPTQAMRTAEGVQQFTAGIAVKLQYFVENFASLVFVPAVQQFICLLKDNLPHEAINAILSDEDGKAYEGDVMEVYNGNYRVEVLSSTKLTARRAMASQIPNIVQLLAAPPVLPALAQNGKKFNFEQLFDDMLDLAGWDSSEYIVPMTPQEQQQMMAMNPGVQKAQAQQAALQQQQQNAIELESAKSDGRAQVQVIRTLLKHAEPGSLDAAAGVAEQPLGAPQQ